MTKCGDSVTEWPGVVAMSRDFVVKWRGVVTLLGAGRADLWLSGGRPRHAIYLYTPPP
jgi:hypothetical protein